VSEPGR